MNNRDIIVIGASAGGVTALKQVLSALPAGFTTPIFVVQHVAPYTTSLLPQVLNHAGRLKAVHPKDNEVIQPGYVYVAPPDHHLLIEDHHVIVKKGPKENRFRPSIDALFRSAAYTFGTRVIGVVLTGLLNDGTSGMWSVKRMGGLCVVQAPEDAMYASMPESVMEFVEVDYVVPLTEIASLLCKLTQDEAPEAPSISQAEKDRIETEVQIAAQENAFNMGVLSMGNPTFLTCPECHGALVGFKEGKLIRYRCHTGHAYTASALLAEVTKSVEEAFWNTIRGLEETVMLLDQSATLLEEAGDHEGAAEFRRRADNTRERAEKLHELVYKQEQMSAASVIDLTKNSESSA
ncbi:chemotaxis protein CheB [Spirosoma soli]|uniref:protein-glutamate methylesterase n=1 Tax=Spirosoma soli TaxID=1770529 RepID=A0ABW5M6W3_9BACT